MPYKLKKNRKKYNREYSTFRAKRNSALRKAVLNGDFAKAKRISQRKPNINIKPRKKTPTRKKTTTRKRKH